MPTNQMSEVIQHLRRTVLVRDAAGLTDGQLLEDYLSRRQEAALAVLVRRHGPMVWGVCRRVLRNYHDAEDAFQATFLVFTRKAASIASRELLANWLYGVAHQTALKAKATAGRRRTRERQVTDMPEPEVVQQDLWHDLQPLLDQELSRLPDKYRVPIVLCDLEGKTRKEAAQQLGCPEGTIAGRLARARVMLAKRLARHGLTLSGGALAGVLSQNMASAAVPTAVVSSTIKAASLFAAGQAVASGVISAKVAALTEGVLKAMLLTKLKIAVVVLLALTLAGGGVGMLALPTLQAGSPDGADTVVFRETEANTQEKQPKTDQEMFQGLWVTVMTVDDGKEQKGIIGGMEIVGDKLVMTSVLGESEYTLTLDTAKTPKRIDITFTQGKGVISSTKGERSQGIYRLVDNTLTICLGPSDKARPTQFVSKPGSGHSLAVLQRLPPADKGAGRLLKDQPSAKVETKGNTLAVKNVLLRSVNAERNTISVTIGAKGNANGWLELGDLNTLLKNQKDKTFISLGLFVGTADGKIAFIPMNSAQLENLPVAKNAKIVLDGKESKLADLKADSFMTFQLATDGEKIEVREIHVGK